MSKEIALKLKITSQGEEKVISNIGELEAELQKLQTTLKTLDFGSKAFKEATINISKLRTKIDEVDKASEGIGAEKKFRAFGDAINILTGSFQVASGALSLFISDEKSLEEVQKAEAAALNVLNIALGVNAINTALVESATLRKAIADKVAAVATEAAAVAQRIYNAALNANPIALVITAVATLTLAIVAFTNETKKSVKGLDELKVKTDTINGLNEKSIEIRTEEIKKIQTLISVSELENLKKTDRVKVLKLIQAQYPNYLKNQNLEKVSLEQIKTANEALIDSITKVARARASADKLAEIQGKKIQIETERQVALQNQLEQQALAYNLLDASQTQKQITTLNNLGKIRDKIAAGKIKELDIQEKAVVGYIKENNLVDSLVGTFDKGGEAVKNYSDKELAFIQKRIKALDSIISKLNEAQRAEIKYTSTLLETQQQVLDEQKTYIEKRSDFLKSDGEKLIDELNDYLFKTIPGIEEVKKLSDGYKDLFFSVRKAIEKGDIDFTKNTGFDTFVKYAEKELPGITEKLKGVNDESKKAFVEYFNSLDNRVSALRTNIEGLDLGMFNQAPNKEQLKILLDTEKQIADLRSQRVELGLTDNDLEAASLKIIKDNFGISQKGYEIIKKYSKESYDYAVASLANDTEKLKLLQPIIDAEDEELKKLNEVAKAILDGVIRTDEFVVGLVEVGKESDKNYAKILKLKEQIDATFDPTKLEGLKKYFKENADDFLVFFTEILNNEAGYFNKLGEAGITALFSGIDEGLSKVEGKSRAELENIQKYLKLFGDEFAKDFGLSDNPFIKALNEISKKLKQLPTESATAFNKTIDSIKKISDVVLSSFNQISTQLSNIVSQQNSLLLEQLQYQQDQALKLIGEANTENEAENKRIAAERLKVEKEFQKKKFDIEKQARVQELQFALANALAASAQGIISALATPPLGVGIALAAILAGLAGAQVAIIRDQIDFTQNKAYLGRTGGLVEGSSHDTYGGGVPTMLEGGEFILNKEAVRAYGDQISSINSATGGKPMSIDDSRIVQAISKQNLSTKQPLKAYVLYNDIQDTTKLNNKIEQLARL